MQILPLLDSSKAIVYVDFVRDSRPLAIAICQSGHQSYGYHGGGMSVHDKQTILVNWQSGQIQVMVCTSAFGMGIDQPDIDAVIRVGCPQA